VKATAAYNASPRWFMVNNKNLFTKFLHQTSRNTRHPDNVSRSLTHTGLPGRQQFLAL